MTKIIFIIKKKKFNNNWLEGKFSQFVEHWTYLEFRENYPSNQIIIEGMQNSSIKHIFNLEMLADPLQFYKAKHTIKLRDSLD